MKTSTLYLFLFFVFFICSIEINAQSKKTQFEFCLELDALPYLTGGYFGAMTVGTEKMRLRLLYTEVNMPPFITPAALNKHHIQSLAVLGDYFCKNSTKGIWIGGGFVKWDGSIEHKISHESGSYTCYLMNGSMGYIYPLNKHFYISPWAGMSIRTLSDKNIKVGNQTYTPSLFNPEASLKLGYRFR